MEHQIYDGRKAKQAEHSSWTGLQGVQKGLQGNREEQHTESYMELLNEVQQFLHCCKLDCVGFVYVDTVLFNAEAGHHSDKEI